MTEASSLAREGRNTMQTCKVGPSDDRELHRAELIEISMKPWPVLLARIRKK
jgi:hypothetical protein